TVIVRNLVLTSFPTRRSSDLVTNFPDGGTDAAQLARLLKEMPPIVAPQVAPSGSGPAGSDSAETKRERKEESRSPAAAQNRCLLDRKSTRLNSSHRTISYAVF